MVSQSTGSADGTIADLALLHLHKSFDGKEIVRDTSLMVSKGELCCLLGPSGCGKTTMLNIISGFLEPDGGTVLLGGHDITPVPPQQRNIGMVFQDYALFPHMTVYDNVAYGLKRRGWPRTRTQASAGEILEMVKMSGYEQRAIHELSCGEQQRVALARALVIEPSLLLLDEPLSNLDAHLRTDMRSEIRRIQQTLGITTVYVTHDQEEAMSISDRIAVMNNGAIEQVGTSREIYEQPSTRFVADFIGKVNFIPGSIKERKLQMLGMEFPLPSGEWPEGVRVICAIRPERIVIDSHNPSTVYAVVQDITYLGAVVRYRVNIDYQTEAVQLIIDTPSTLASFLPGDNVSVTFPTDNIILFPDSNSD